MNHFKENGRFPEDLSKLMKIWKLEQKRELAEETGLKNIALTQFKTYGTPGRDPRGRTISVVYYGFLTNESPKIEAGDDADEASWFELHKLPELAFDHKFILDEFIALQE